MPADAGNCKTSAGLCKTAAALLAAASRIGPGGAGLSTFLSPLEKEAGNAIVKAGGALIVLSMQDFGNADAIANLKQGGGVEQNGKLGSFFCKMFRSSATEARNNAVRTELLRALGQGFGIEGMTEKDGKTYFSADFMAKLERTLGRDVFKASDFKLNSDGSVSSGKPLTQRRIQAIVEKAGIYANTGFSVGAYRQKLESIKKDLGIAGLSGAQLDALNKNEKTPSMTKLFIHVAKSLDFLEGLEFGKPALDKKTGKPLGYYTYSKNEDTSFIRLDPTLGFKLELGDDVSKWRDNRFQFRMPGSKEGDYQPLNGNLGDFEHGFNHQLFLALGGELIHTERAHFDSSGTDIEPLKKYIAQTILREPGRLHGGEGPAADEVRGKALRAARAGGDGPDQGRSRRARTHREPGRRRQRPAGQVRRPALRRHRRAQPGRRKAQRLRKLGRFLRGRQGEARRQDGEDRGPVQERRDRLL